MDGYEDDYPSNNFDDLIEDAEENYDQGGYEDEQLGVDYPDNEEAVTVGVSAG